MIGDYNRGSVGVGEELEAAASDVTSTILSQRLEIDNKNKSVVGPLTLLQCVLCVCGLFVCVCIGRWICCRRH